MNLYVREDVPAGVLVAVNVSGTAPVGGAGANGRTDQGRDAQQGGGGSGGATIQSVPGRLDVLKWPLIGLFALVFGLLAFLLARKPVVAVAGADLAATDVPAANSKKSKLKSAPASPHAPVAAKGSSNGLSNLAEVDAAISPSLDALKESLFRLELRHQAGTISEEEYARERARAEKVLRDLVRG